MGIYHKISNFNQRENKYEKGGESHPVMISVSGMLLCTTSIGWYDAAVLETSFCGKMQL